MQSTRSPTAGRSWQSALWRPRGRPRRADGPTRGRPPRRGPRWPARPTDAGTGIDSGAVARTIIDLSAPIVASPPETPEPLRTEISFSGHDEGAKTIEGMLGVP